MLECYTFNPKAQGRRKPNESTFLQTLRPNPDTQKDLKIRSPRTIGELSKDYIGVIMGLYRGPNF